MLSAVRCAVVVALTAVVAACSSSSKPVAIHSNPEAVSIQVNGQEIGSTPTQYAFSFPDENTRHVVRATKEGYHDRDFVISEAQMAQLAGIIRITMEAHEKSALITSEPGQARVEIEGIEVGLTPVEFGFDFKDRSRRHVVKLSKPGYFDTAVPVTEKSEGIQSGVVKVVLQENPAWRVTSESEATNRWLRIAIDPRIQYLSAWQRIIDSVTSVYDSLEQLDQQSGYLRSSPQIREFPKGPDGPFLVRTQFIGSISTQDPLTYKIKLVAQTRGKHESSEAWAEFDRVFAQDAQLVEELQNRMGIK